jgi:hypothetical protein
MTDFILGFISGAGLILVAALWAFARVFLAAARSKT